MESNEPLVSYIVLSYNQEAYIGEAIASALAQKYQNIEFIFSDDASSDQTYDVMEDLTHNSDRNIRLVKNENNLGLTQHVNKCFKEAQGNIVLIAAGDDIALSNRTSKTVEYFKIYPEVCMLSFNDLKLIGNIATEERLFDLKRDNVVSLSEYIEGYFTSFSGASRAIRKDVILEFKDLLSTCPTEDTPYILRSLMYGKALVSSDPGILYRTHNNNLSSPDNLQKMNFDELHRQYEIDLGLAKSNGLLSSKEYKKINAWIRNSSILRSVMFEPWGVRKLVTYIYLLLVSKNFRVRLARKIKGIK